MRAVVISRPGGPEALEVCEVPKPAARFGEVLVRVHACALNRADLLQRRGHYPAPPGVPADIPGMEFAGEVEAVGDDARLWRPGQRVMGLIGGGAQAEYLVAHERTLAAIPDNLSWEQAASIPEVFITAHDALWVQAALRPGERVLIHAIGSGVGLAALQLARAMQAIPYGTSRTADKLEQAQKLGMEAGWVVPNSPTAQDGRRWSASGGFDAIIDLAGGAYVNASLQALAPRGRVMLIGTLAGAKAEIDLGMALSKRAHLIGTVLRARALEEKIAVTQRFAREVLPLFANGVLQTVIDSTFNLDEIRQAHERMESNQSFGKIVIRIA
ncbi:MAG: NAD(P)H-quinone oxidoreductase [Acidobacteria bacterium]|nr:NAD(P)H-quinone oxidoreductase [Acidobacteriota bacterium]MBV9147158.1 NAD(P)H-quinone oxidoreductase [Acidobacteriota bacterium]MBV9437771.1 NAD(P)H-quinone oxidoreductase [Acidobacteriota bacterium]